MTLSYDARPSWSAAAGGDSGSAFSRRNRDSKTLYPVNSSACGPQRNGLPTKARMPSSPYECRDAPMDRAIAKRLMEAALSLDEGIGRLDGIVSDMSDGQEKKELVKALGEILRVVTKEFVFRVTREYPDLDPDR